MEVAGLAIGVAGLAGLFNACNSTFQLIQRGRSFGKDFKILETKFGNQELRLRAWGRACGLIDGTEYDKRLDEPELHQQLLATLECIKLLLTDAEELRTKYGLELGGGDEHDHQSVRLSMNHPPPPSINSDSSSSSRTSSGSSIAERRRSGSLNRFLFRHGRPRSQATLSRSTSTLATTLWVIEDREKFSELVKHLKDFIDDLESLTRATEVPRRQLVFVEYEVECMSDIEELEDMEEAGDGEDDVVSEAASARLERISQGSTSVRASLESTGTFFSLESYYTARTHFSRPGSIAEIPEISLPPPAIPKVKPPKVKPSRIRITQKVNSQYKCVVVGELSARKTDLLAVFILGYSPTKHTPLVFKEYVTDCQIDGQRTSLALWDTSGQEDYEQLRKPALANADVVLICALLDSASEIEQSAVKWATEIAEQCPGAPYLLVGINPSGEDKAKPELQRAQYHVSRNIRAATSMQCNVDTGEGIDDVFEAAARVAIMSKHSRDDSRIKHGPRPSRTWKLPWIRDRTKLKPINESPTENQKDKGRSLQSDIELDSAMYHVHDRRDNWYPNLPLRVTNEPDPPPVETASIRTHSKSDSSDILGTLMSSPLFNDERSFD